MTTTESLPGALTRRSKQVAKRLIGYDSRNWLRIRQIEAFTAFLEADGRKSSDVIEVSPGWNRYWKTMCSTTPRSIPAIFRRHRRPGAGACAPAACRRAKYPCHDPAGRLGDGDHTVPVQGACQAARPLDSRRPEAGDGRSRLPGIRDRSVRLGQQGLRKSPYRRPSARLRPMARPQQRRGIPADGVGILRGGRNLPPSRGETILTSSPTAPAAARSTRANRRDS